MQLGCQIISGNPEARELAMDVLVNLAAGSDGPGREAQAVLRDLYADPGQFADANGLQAHGKEEVRNNILSAAHRMCELALNARGHAGGGMPLSLTVAYLGGQCTSPPNGNTMRGLIQSHLSSGLTNQGRSLPDIDKLLEPGRPVSHAELAGAAAGFKHLAVHPEPLSIHTGEPAAAAGVSMAAALTDLRSALASEPSPGCTAAWIDTGGAAKPSWMPLILQKDADGTMSCHLVDASPAGGDRDGIHGKLCKLLEGAGFAQDQIHVHKAHTPPNQPAGDDAALGHRLLKALGGALVEAGNSPARSTGAMREFIGTHAHAWTDDADPEDRQAAVLSARAELLESDAGPAMQIAVPGPSAGPVPSVPMLPAVSLGAMPSTSPPLAVGADVSPAATIPQTPARAAALARLKEPVDTIGLRRNEEGVIVSDGTSLSRFINESVVAPSAHFASVESPVTEEQLAESIRPLAKELAKLHELNASLESASSCLCSKTRRSPGLDSFLAKKFDNLGTFAFVGQRPGRYQLLLGEVAKLSAAPHGDNFRKLMQEIQTVVKNDVGFFFNAITELEKILNEPVFRGPRLWWSERNGQTVHSPRVHREAAALRDQLMHTYEAYRKPEGWVQKLASFAKLAEQEPEVAAELVRARVK